MKPLTALAAERNLFSIGRCNAATIRQNQTLSASASIVEISPCTQKTESAPVRMRSKKRRWRIVTLQMRFSPCRNFTVHFRRRTKSEPFVLSALRKTDNSRDFEGYRFYMHPLA